MENISPSGREKEGSMSWALSGPAFSSISLKISIWLDEGGHIGQVLEGLENGFVVVELDLAQALGRSLVEEEQVVPGREDPAPPGDTRPG